MEILFFISLNVELKSLFTGRGGASIYGKEFGDEITNELKHTGNKLKQMYNTCI